MNLTIRGDFNEEFVGSAVKKATSLLKIPKKIKLNIFVIDNIKFCPVTSGTLKGESAKEFKKLCKEEATSMSLTYKKNNHVIIHISKFDNYLKTNKKALIGVLLHELMHIVQTNKSLDNKIRKAAIFAFNKFKKELFKIGQPKQNIINFYSNIGESTNYVLKDIYANLELINKGFTDYILEDYYNLYFSKKKCIKPKLQKQTLEQIENAINYQLELLSVIIPFTKVQRKPKAKKLINYLKKCYEPKELSEEFKELTSYTLKNFSWRKNFRQNFFMIVFKKSLDLIF